MTDITSSETAVLITVDGKQVLAKSGELLIDACERNGTYIPRFCHHSRMQPVGMCRMCLVEIDTGRGPALQPSCMIECTNEMVVDTQSEKTLKAQEGVLEFLLINHPLDCPICDKGGECPLQDQTMTFGAGESRFIEEKRTYRKPIAVNENVFLDRERCVLCDRCTRFADQVAGDSLIHFIDRGNKTQVNTYPDQPFSSYFSGNTVQICPVGALTAAPFRFKARPWDLTEVESTSTFDSVGNRISVQESRDRVLRFTGVDSDSVNWGWLTDKERFIFESYSNETRLVEPLIINEFAEAEKNQFVPTSWAEAYEKCFTALTETTPERIAVIGGARLTNEAQYVWSKITKGIIGTDNVDAQLDDGFSPEVLLSLNPSTIDKTCKPGGVIILLGADPKEELGTLYLRLRHAIVQDHCKLIELTPTKTGLSKLATHSIRIPPGKTFEAVKALSGESSALEEEILKELFDAGKIIKNSNSVSVLLGRTSLAETSSIIEDGAITLQEYLPEASFLPLLRRGNINGAIDMGLSPGLLPGRCNLEEGSAELQNNWLTRPNRRGFNTKEILEAAINGQIDVLVLLASDPVMDFPDSQLVQEALERIETVIAVDIFLTDSLLKADVVLPAATTTEIDGSFTNLEGRISPIRRSVTPPGTARPDWMIGLDLVQYLAPKTGPSTFKELCEEISLVSEIHKDFDFSKVGQIDKEGVVLNRGLQKAQITSVKIPKQKANCFRLVVTRSMYDKGVLAAHSSALQGLAPGGQIKASPEDMEKLGITSESTVRLIGSKGEIRTRLTPDPETTRGTIHVLWNQEGPDIRKLIDSSLPVNDLKIEKT
jgi:NADH-quinone oxidoreductase subunit G